jgi:hypothetical protein
LKADDNYPNNERPRAIKKRNPQEHTQQAAGYSSSRESGINGSPSAPLAERLIDPNGVIPPIIQNSVPAALRVGHMLEPPFVKRVPIRPSAPLIGVDQSPRSS